MKTESEREYEAFRGKLFSECSSVVIVTGYLGHAGVQALLGGDIEKPDPERLKKAVFSVVPEKNVMIFPCGQDGLLGAFYRFSEDTRQGIVVFQEAIPILQEDVEYAEERGSDLFFLSAENSSLIEVPRNSAEKALTALRSEGFPCSAVGTIAPYPVKEMWRRGRKVYLKRPGRTE